MDYDDSCIIDIIYKNALVVKAIVKKDTLAYNSENFTKNLTKKI